MNQPRTSDTGHRHDTAFLDRAKRLLLPHMDEEQRGSWLTQAFHGADENLYGAIPQAGATQEFGVGCIRRSLGHGACGPRHALSLLLEVVRPHAGDEEQDEVAEQGSPVGAGHARGQQPHRVEARRVVGEGILEEGWQGCTHPVVMPFELRGPVVDLVPRERSLVFYGGVKLVAQSTAAREPGPLFKE